MNVAFIINILVTNNDAFIYITKKCLLYYLHTDIILQGHPFMESLRENKPLLYSLIFSGAAITAIASGLLPDISNHFELVELTTEASNNNNVCVCVCVQGW